MIETYNRVVLKKVLKLARDPKLRAVEISVTYDEESLRDAVIHVSPASTEENQAQVVISERGAQTVIVGIPKQIHKTNADEREEYLKKQLWQLRRPFQGALDEIYLGKDLVAW